LIKYKKDLKNFENICRFRNKAYGIVGIYLTDFLNNSKKRSQKWHASYISREKFKKLVKPIKYFIPEIKIK
jgi:Zn-dependent oligopeptidase